MLGARRPREGLRGAQRRSPALQGAPQAAPAPARPYPQPSGLAPLSRNLIHPSCVHLPLTPQGPRRQNFYNLHPWRISIVLLQVGPVGLAAPASVHINEGAVGATWLGLRARGCPAARGGGMDSFVSFVMWAIIGLSPGPVTYPCVFVSCLPYPFFVFVFLCVLFLFDM